MLCGECDYFTVEDDAPVEFDGPLGYCEKTRDEKRTWERCSE